MASLFEQTLLGGLALKNRFIRSATNERMATPQGGMTPEINAMHSELARGQVGLIINGHTAVSPEGKAGPRQHTLYKGARTTGMPELTRAVHDFGGAVCLQLAHAGIFARPEEAAPDGRPGPVGPSAPPEFPGCRALQVAEIDRLVDAFANAAGLAKECGFDAVQIHAAHGYLLSQFLSPYFNRRTDEYGGSVENRARFLLRTVQAVRAVVGSNFPVLVKINSDDFIDKGFSVDDAAKVAEMLEKASVDCIELSGGSVAGVAKISAVRPGPVATREQEAFYRDAAKLIKPRLSIPLMLVGGIRSIEVAEELLESGTADYISLSRPLICEPGLVKRWSEGDRRKALCVTDNLCFTRREYPLHCVTFAKKRAQANN